MSLDNKQSRNKLFAFEINNIMKAIRQLAQNIIDLNKTQHWEYISAGSGTSINVPANANFAIINFSFYANGYSECHQAQVTLSRTGTTSAAHVEGKLYTSSGNSSCGVGISWSGSTISIASSGGSITAVSMNMYAVFFT